MRTASMLYKVRLLITDPTLRGQDTDHEGAAAAHRTLLTGPDHLLQLSWELYPEGSQFSTKYELRETLNTEHG